MIKHLVLLKWAAHVTPAQQDALLNAIVGLQSQIDGISACESGHNQSPEGLAKGFTHLVQMCFIDAAARDAYLPHAAHAAFVAQLKPCVDEVLVFDYEAPQ